MASLRVLLLALLALRGGAFEVPRGPPTDTPSALSAKSVRTSGRDAVSHGGGAWSGSVFEQGEALKGAFSPTKFYLSCRQVWLAWNHHWTQISAHSAYVVAVARRSGLQLWAGRGILAALLVRFRLTAFTSEVGESLRPLIASWYVRAAYAVSWSYVSVDVLLRVGDSFALRGRTWHLLRTLLYFSIFHTVATMLLPAFLIHSAVHHSSHLLKLLSARHAAAVSAAAERLPLWWAPRLWWVPTVVGLALIPLMPLLDEPFEHLLDSCFASAGRAMRSLAVYRAREAPPRVSDYGAATDGAELGDMPSLYDAPPPHVLQSSPVNREEPELIRAKGRGEPAYERPSMVGTPPAGIQPVEHGLGKNELVPTCTAAASESEPDPREPEGSRGAAQP